jgi:hypothetical protein
LRTKIGPDEAEFEGCGGSTVKADNQVWPDLRRNPKGWANFPHFLVTRRSKILHIRRSSLLELRKIGSQRHPRES